MDKSLVIVSQPSLEYICGREDMTWHRQRSCLESRPRTSVENRQGAQKKPLRAGGCKYVWRNNNLYYIFSTKKIRLL